MSLTIKDIMESITVAFKQKVTQWVEVGAKGTVLILRKNTSLTNAYRLTSFSSAVFSMTDSWGDDYTDLEAKIKQVFDGGAKEVVLLEYKVDMASVASVITNANWNWLMSLESEDQAGVSSLCKEQERFGLVYNLQSDSVWVHSVNNPSGELANDATIDGSSTITGLDLLPIAIGVIAGCPYSKSISYKIFTMLKSVALPSEIIEGQITFYNEEEGVRIASPVNTLTSVDEDNTEDMKSIAIMEGMKRMKDDMVYAFRTQYKGAYKNKLDNQALFYSAGEFYLSELEKLGVLDPEYDNKIDVDHEATKALWEAQGKDTSGWDEYTIKKTTYKKLIVPLIDCKFLDAIEGMQMTVQMY